MPALLIAPTDEAGQSIDAALVDMERRAEQRNRVESHLQLCGECDDVLCPAGAELVREALG